MPSETDKSSALKEGIVFRTHSGNYFVQLDGGETVVCKLRGNLKKELVYSTSDSRPRRVESAKKRRSTDPLTVGDRVRVDADQAIIEEVLPRRSDLSRLSPSGRGQHTLVANLDQAFLMTAAAYPRPDWWQMDRFLVLAEAADIAPRLILNKADRLEGESAEIRAAAEAGAAVYAAIGYPVFWTSAKTGQGIEAVRDALRGRVSAFAGPSGVGKSSLLNAVEPGLTLKTGDIGDVTFQGKHTTTTAELLPLTGGGWVADTPGLRQVDFWEVDADQIQFCFPEFAPYLGGCRFAGCLHRDEPECAVRAGVDSGAIVRRRYDSYVQMTGEERGKADRGNARS